jgi:hypothetical protein
MSNDPAVSFEEAFSRLGDGLLNNQTVKVGSFWEFLRDVWSQSLTTRNTSRHGMWAY